MLMRRLTNNGCQRVLELLKKHLPKLVKMSSEYGRVSATSAIGIRYRAQADWLVQ
ncbi:hypothetical protein ABTQ33_00890 [Paucilactobacillus suebicus]|uniref:hypothetical protein n=1 Tax=Paucilactobacillus suebicus TaxID=152335 RepID=UPI000AE249C0